MNVLITGGSGTFGQAFARHLLKHGAPIVKKIIIYSRDEQKQEAIARELAPLDPHQCLRFFLGDVRDLPRLRIALRDTDIVIHAAALKIVPKCEYDPIEAVATNVSGAENVIQASIGCKVKRVVAISTDKAVAPVNLYGATKLAAERLFIAANHLSGATGDTNATRFSVVRYGNVANSRGSVIPLFKEIAARGEPLPITHPEMTRFWITIEQAVNWVDFCLSEMHGGEVFIPRMPSFRVVDLVTAIQFPKISWHGIPLPIDSGYHKIVGIRPGEKIHEVLITSHDAPKTISHESFFRIEPEWRKIKPSLPDDFVYSSDTNTEWLSVDDLRKLIA